MNVVTAILSLLVQAPQAISEILALWQAVRSGVGATDQATVDQAIKTLSDKIDADVAQLDADAKAHGG